MPSCLDLRHVFECMPGSVLCSFACDWGSCKWSAQAYSIGGTIDPKINWPMDNWPAGGLHDNWPHVVKRLPPKDRNNTCQTDSWLSISGMDDNRQILDKMAPLEICITKYTTRIDAQWHTFSNDRIRYILAWSTSPAQRPVEHEVRL